MVSSNTASPQVREDYRVHMIMDNLPAATKMIAEMPDGTKKDMYDRGFRYRFSCIGTLTHYHPKHLHFFSRTDVVAHALPFI